MVPSAHSEARRPVIPFETIRSFFAILAILANVAVFGAIVLFLGSRVSLGMAETRARLEASLMGYELWFAFTVALVAMVGSLYLSEVVGFEPCKLCWYQRIAMYPLVPILGIAAWRSDRRIRPYAVTLAAIGGVIGFYHYLLQNFPSMSSSVSCSPTAPCTAIYIWEFGFISIPYMALSAFALIITLMVVAQSNDRRAAIPIRETEVAQ